ncbi:MAG: hypothetical protein ACYDHX_17070 [Methanothrix sp.]
MIRPLCVLISSSLPGAGGGANVALPGSLRILVRRFRTRGRSPQGPPACACPRPCARVGDGAPRWAGAG